ncbi:P48 [Rachiplusia nu nucleopolyhedrovirus]|uniref:P48 n=1 Tax=Rachiplusia nu nucleopolyhedrovirus TaxID=2605775 RepID=A0AAE6M5Q9_9ABAC|nr:P48 [Rachiplusia nu nucleopolyhedrovirus]QEI03684.1 P48 [Rachiplusia nu nucleopolyhedrovirus]
MAANTVYLVEYTLRFNKYDVFQYVNFNVRLSAAEIDSLTFLFSKYFDQSNNVSVKGLTFFNEFNKCVEAVKRDFESKQENNDVKKIFSVFLKDEFMSQVPQFRTIMQYLQKYYKITPAPVIEEISSKCNMCSINKIDCISCKINYLSRSISVFDSAIQDGWDIFLRPMFGLPIFLFILLKTDYDKNGVFNADDLITNSFTQFFYNLLCDKATSNYLNYKSSANLIKECRRVTANLKDHELEQLLCQLRNNNTCETKLFAPFKQFITELALKTKIKSQKVNKIASVVFTGFYLRLYLEGAANKTKSASELEIRNVCRFILNKYNDEQFEKFMIKIGNIKQDLFKETMEQYIVSERYIRQLVGRHNLDQELYLLLNDNDIIA